MKILVLSDTHAGIRNDESSFYDYMKKSNEYMFSVIDSQKITEIIHLGDLFDRRKYVNFITAKHCREDLIEPLVKRGLNINIIAGNHDVFHKTTNEVNSLQELIGNRYNNLHIHIDPVKLIYDGTEILLLPWIPESKDEAKPFLDAIENTSAQILFGHLEITGFQMDGGSVCHKGLDASVLSRFDVVASGHFHKPQKIGNIRYLGAMYQNNWGEYGEDRGFSVFDTDTREFTFYKNPYTIYEQVVYNDELNEKWLQDMVTHGNFSNSKNKYVKIIIETKKNPYLFDMFSDKITESGPIKLTFEDNQPFFNEEETDKIINQAQDTPSILSSYIDDLNLELDSNRMKVLMSDTYKEAISLESVE